MRVSCARPFGTMNTDTSACHVTFRVTSLACHVVEELWFFFFFFAFLYFGEV